MALRGWPFQVPVTVKYDTSNYRAGDLEREICQIVYSHGEATMAPPGRPGGGGGRIKTRNQ